MPLYDYRCSACQKVTEVRHGFGETFTGACPACGGKLNRVFNPAPIVFKGSGFYVTDSRKGSGAAAKDAPAKETAPKEATAKDTTAKDTTAKDTAAKESAPKESKPAKSATDPAA